MNVKIVRKILTISEAQSLLKGSGARLHLLFRATGTFAGLFPAAGIALAHLNILLLYTFYTLLSITRVGRQARAGLAVQASFLYSRPLARAFLTTFHFVK